MPFKAVDRTLAASTSWQSCRDLKTESRVFSFCFCFLPILEADQLLLTDPPVTWFESPTTSCQLLLDTFHLVNLPSKMQAYSRGSRQAQSELAWLPHGSGPCPPALPGPCLLSEPCSTADQVCFWLNPEQSSGLLDSKELGPRTVHVTKMEGPCLQPS